MMRLGVHEFSQCEESDGCIEVVITRVWNHENFEQLEGDAPNDNIPNNDISILQ